MNLQHKLQVRRVLAADEADAHASAGQAADSAPGTSRNGLIGAARPPLSGGPGRRPSTAAAEVLRSSSGSVSRRLTADSVSRSPVKQGLSSTMGRVATGR